MCLAVPCKVVELKQFPMATIEMEGLRKEVSIELVADVQIGEYVIVHVGYALSKLDQQSAQENLEALAELRSLHEQS